MVNSVDPDETAHYEPSHLDLHYLKKSWSQKLKGLKITVHLLRALLFISRHFKGLRHTESIFSLRNKKIINFFWMIKNGYDKPLQDPIV